MTTSPSFVSSAGTAAMFLSFLLAPALSAQRLIGGANSPATGPVLATQPWCGPSARLCSPILGAPPAPFAGGTAYDPMRQLVWDTDGVRLTGVRATSVPPCSVHCAPAAAPLPAGAMATGLAFDESRNALWMIDSSPGLSLLRMSATTTCPVLTARCDLTPVIAAGHVPGALAFSGRHQLLFWSSAVFGGGPAANLVYVAAAANPCVVTCRITVLGTVPCGGAPLGPITGMAYDDCDDQLYVTDGTRVLRATFLPTCGVTNFQCCAAPVVAPWYGLDVEPAHPTRRGASCLAATCGACPNMLLDTVGDPTLGNPAFALRITGAPVGSVAFLCFDPGPCGAGVAFLCGLYHPAALPPALLLGPIGLAGGAACSGSGSFPLPIPMDPTLCGDPFCVQGIIVCLPAGLGLTNAVDLRISDS